MNAVNQTLVKKLIDKRNLSYKGSLIFFRKAYTPEQLADINKKAEESQARFRFILDLSGKSSKDSDSSPEKGDCSVF